MHVGNDGLESAEYFGPFGVMYAVVEVLSMSARMHWGLMSV